MKGIIRLVVLAAAVVAIAGRVEAYDPPRIIGHLHGDAPPDSQNFGLMYCNVGDQNGDGYDDLLVSHDANGYPGEYHVNALKLFYGGPEVNDTADFKFHWPSGESPDNFIYAGRLDSTNSQWIFIRTLRWALEQHPYQGASYYFYKGGAVLDTIPELSFETDAAHGFATPGSWDPMGNPADYNGDGYDDLLMIAGGESQVDSARAEILFGGPVFDTIPDWYSTLPNGMRGVWGIRSSSGDINGDGNEDIILNMNHNQFSIYLGGNPMDTIPIIQLSLTDYRPKYLVNFAVVGDVNGDGYDDWGCYWHTIAPDRDGFYVFYGSDHLDMEPDIELQGSINLWDTAYGWIVGGDFNGDHTSDIVTIIPLASHAEGELQLYLGSRWFNHRHRMALNMLEVYGRYIGARAGAVGDYNGDGVKDFVSSNYTGWGGWDMGNVYIFAGSSDWPVSVPAKPTSSLQYMQLAAHPNPFNSTTGIHYSQPFDGRTRLSIYDIAGQLVTTIQAGDRNKRSGSAEWTAPASGIYFARLVVEGKDNTRYSSVVKMVCIR